MRNDLIRKKLSPATSWLAYTQALLLAHSCSRYCANNFRLH